jgi:predicted dehydrogenase
MTRELKIGLIGLGYIGKVHATAYRDIPICISRPKATANLAAVLRSRLDTEQEAMHSSGFTVTTTDPDEFFATPLDIVDVCSPNYLHFDQVCRALGLGLSVYCEKPLTTTLSEACSLADLAEKNAVNTHVALVMRYIPGIRQMKAILLSGQIGEIYHFRAQMFHGSYLDPDRPMSWRLRKSQSGGGAFMDLGAHLVDLTRYLLGDVALVRATMRTYITERSIAADNSRREKVDVDDWTLCNLDLVNGATGVIEVTRMAAGAGEATKFEIFGSQGALSYDHRNPDTVSWFDLKRKRWISGAIDFPAAAGERPYEQVWPGSKYSQGTMTNAHLASAYDFMLNVAGDSSSSMIDFHAGAAAQEIVEAAYISAEHGANKVKLPL